MSRRRFAREASQVEQQADALPAASMVPPPYSEEADDESESKERPVSGPSLINMEPARMVPLISQDSVKWEVQASEPFVRAAVTLGRETLIQTQQTHRRMHQFSQHIAQFAIARGLSYGQIPTRRLLASYLYPLWGAHHLLTDEHLDISQRTAKEVFEHELLGRAPASLERIEIPLTPGRIITSRTIKKPGGIVVNIPFDGDEGRDFARRLGDDPTTLKNPTFSIGTLRPPKGESIATPPEVIAAELQESFRGLGSRSMLDGQGVIPLLFGRLQLGYSIRVARNELAKERQLPYREYG